MKQDRGKCPGCDAAGRAGEPCTERACQKRSYHFIPEHHWERAASGTAPDAIIGQRVGDFIVVDFLGAGGFGKVFLALQTPLLRLKGALKLIEFPTDNVALIQTLLKKFQGEAEALAQLSHPNIVRLLKYGTHGERPYLVMEFVEGGHTLRDEIYARATRRQSFSHDELFAILNQVLNGLEAAHEQSIIHRDIKPENIMLQRVVGNPHHVRILDFGTAKFVETRSDTHWPMGSPSYMAPEQVALKNLGPWTDLYAVGVIAYELLSGRRPFPGATDQEILLKKLDHDFDPLDALRRLALPDATLEFLGRALAREPEARFAHAAPFREAMQRALDAWAHASGGADSRAPSPAAGADLTGLLDSRDLALLTEESSDLPDAASPNDAAPNSATTVHDEATAVQVTPSPSPAPPPTPQRAAPRAAQNTVVRVELPPEARDAAAPRRTKRVALAAIALLLAAGGGFYATSSGLWSGLGAGAGPDVVTAGMAPGAAGEHAAPGNTADLDVGVGDATADASAVGDTSGRGDTSLEGDARATGDTADSDVDSDVEADVAAAEGAARYTAYPAALPADWQGQLMQVSVGKFHTCVLFRDGAVRCWGSNQDGELGLGHTDAIGATAVAATAPLVAPFGKRGERVVQVAAAGDRQASFTCALLDDGAVRCWGSNHFGQLGYGHTRPVPDASAAGDVELGGRAVQLATGAMQYATHACALLDDGAVRCWGNNRYGQLGLGHTRHVGNEHVPTSVAPVALGAKATQVTAGKFHTCALTEGGTVRCWGYNQFGQLGYGRPDNIGDDEIPAVAGDVDVGAPVVQVSAGRAHTCALIEDGRVRCWGWNREGQLGLGHTDNVGVDDTPAAAGDVDIGAPVRHISAGGLHTCALLDDGRVRCWGDNKFGQLGLGHKNNVGATNAPSAAGDVHLGARAVSIDAGNYHTCAILEDDSLRCWGFNRDGQLGLGHTRHIGDDEAPAHDGLVPIL